MGQDGDYRNYEERVAGLLQAILKETYLDVDQAVELRLADVLWGDCSLYFRFPGAAEGQRIGISRELRDQLYAFLQDRAAVDAPQEADSRLFWSSPTPVHGVDLLRLHQHAQKVDESYRRLEPGLPSSDQGDDSLGVARQEGDSITRPGDIDGLVAEVPPAAPLATDGDTITINPNANPAGLTMPNAPAGHVTSPLAQGLEPLVPPINTDVEGPAVDASADPLMGIGPDL